MHVPLPDFHTNSFTVKYLRGAATVWIQVCLRC